MDRLPIGGFQKQAASIVPEFDFDSISQATLDSYGNNAAVTTTIIPYSQFQSETGVGSPHPLAELGQDNIIKVVFSGALSVPAHFINILNIAAIDISRGAVGNFMFIPDRSLTGSVGQLCFFANDSGLANYRRFVPVNYSDNVENEWQFCGGLDDDNYDNLFVDGGSYDAKTIDYIRYTLNTGGSDPTFYMTSTFYNAIRKPTFMIEQDDLNTDTGQWIADCDTYGFKTGLNGISVNVDGVGGKPTTAEVKTFIDNGHAMFTHGDIDYITLGDTAAKAQIDSELSFWRAFYPEKLTDETLLHHALPEGKQTKSIREYMRGLGFKTSRNVGATTVKFAMIGQAEYNSATYLSLPSLGIDAMTLTNFKAHVDKMIQHGQDTCFYIHLNHVNQQEMLAYLKSKQDNGECEVMPRHKWYEKSISQYGERLPI